MKTKDFIENTVKMGYELEGYKGYLYVEAPSYESVKTDVVGYVSTTSPYILSLDFDWKDEELLDLMVEYAKTPLNEREEYYLRYKLINADHNYLNYDQHLDVYSLDRILNYNWIKNKFTPKEIKDIKEKYGTKLEDFEIIKVKQ